MLTNELTSKRIPVIIYTVIYEFDNIIGHVETVFVYQCFDC